MQIARLAITPDNKLKAVGSNPNSLEEAKINLDGDRLSRASVEPATLMLGEFRNLAAQLAAMDNTERQPKPTAPPKPIWLDKLIPGRSTIQKEEAREYEAARAKQAFSNGTDLAPEKGHVLTTSNLNQQKFDAELRLGPQGLGGPAEGSQPLPRQTYLEAERVTSVFNETHYNMREVNQSYSFSSSDDKDTYRCDSKTKDGRLDYSKTLTLDWSTRSAEYIFESGKL